MSIDREIQLATINRKLVSDLNHALKALVAATRMRDLLASVPDWSEATAAIGAFDRVMEESKCR